MTLRLITAPTVEPVSLETAKLFLRVDVSTEDALITSLIKAAREKGEELSRRAFITQTLELTVDGWPQNYILSVPRPPLQSVTSVKYTDRAGAEVTWTDYRVDIKSQPGKIIFDSLPGANLQESGAITVRFVAGYGAAASNVPERLINAINSLTAFWYENREMMNIGNITSELPMGPKETFISERVVWF